MASSRKVLFPYDHIHFGVAHLHLVSRSFHSSLREPWSTALEEQAKRGAPGISPSLVTRSHAGLVCRQEGGGTGFLRGLLWRDWNLLKSTSAVWDAAPTWGLLLPLGSQFLPISQGVGYTENIP